jgi:hypothetical protein
MIVNLFRGLSCLWRANLCFDFYKSKISLILEGITYIALVASALRLLAKSITGISILSLE